MCNLPRIASQRNARLSESVLGDKMFLRRRALRYPDSWRGLFESQCNRFVAGERMSLCQGCRFRGLASNRAFAGCGMLCTEVRQSDLKARPSEQILSTRRVAVLNCLQNLRRRLRGVEQLRSCESCRNESGNRLASRAKLTESGSGREYRDVPARC